MLDDPNIDAETLSFIKNKIATAKDLIEQIKLRHQTLERIVNYIASKQLLFLKMGTPFLEPLLQKEIAESLNISSSTVSRLVSSKYIQTKHGIISLKQCCPRGLYGKTALKYQQMIKTLLEEDNSLSDQALTNWFNQNNIPIARRTVTKYRLNMGIQSSQQRAAD